MVSGVAPKVGLEMKFERDGKGERRFFFWHLKKKKKTGGLCD